TRLGITGITRADFANRERFSGGLAGPVRAGRTNRPFLSRPRSVRPGRVTVSQPDQSNRGMTSSTFSTAFTNTTRPIGEIIDSALAAEIVKQAVQHPDASPELVWLSVTATVAQWAQPPKALPDADLFRAIVAVARRRGLMALANPDAIVDTAARSPLFVEPFLVSLIAFFAQGDRSFPDAAIWNSAWSLR